MINFQNMYDELENNSYYIQDNLISSSDCEKLINYALERVKNNQFIEAGIGRSLNKEIIPEVRKSDIFWIENWEESRQLQNLNLMLTDIMVGLNQIFFLSMKRFESQFALYPKGGFYKKHRDQHNLTRHRLVSTIFYLNDCPDHGELVLYNKVDKSKIDKILYPKKGTFIIFFSGHIYHEVKVTKSERFSITSWLRNDEIIPLV